jgi:hypothetical protein
MITGTKSILSPEDPGGGGGGESVTDLSRERTAGEGAVGGKGD